jgi:hypothetical protein
MAVVPMLLNLIEAVAGRAKAEAAALGLRLERWEP